MNITNDIFSKYNVLVIGSIILDQYIEGDCNRISQEYPIPILDVNNTFYMLGGSANVANNLKKLNCNTYLYGAVGNDVFGNKIKNMLKVNEIGDLVVQNQNYVTSVKTRIITNHKQVYRYDVQETKYLECDIIDVIKCIKKYKINSVIISESMFYKLEEQFTQQLISYCNEQNILCFVDTKEQSLNKYKNVFCIKLNINEFKNLMNYNVNDTLETNLKNIKKIFNIQNIIITLGSEGILFYNNNDVFIHQPTYNVKEIFDVSGAGDTVLAVLCLCWLYNMTYEQMLFLCNKAANIVISKQYTQPIYIHELIDKNKTHSIECVLKNIDHNKKIVFVNGCFDILHRGHIYLLQEAKKYGDILIVGLNSDKSIKKLKGINRPIQSEYDRFFILSSLIYVDYVFIFDEETPCSLLEKIKPDIVIKGEEYKNKDIIEKEVIKKNKGKIIFISSYENKSTTNIIKKIKNVY